jgi:flagellar hook protein FlgE
MSLASSLYSAISGLSATGACMQIIGNNIANSNTAAFKSSSYSFSNLLSQSVATQSGTAQLGRGTGIEDIRSDFTQGSFETTGNATDLAIGGDGFFQVRDFSGESLYYTRAGSFTFDNSGYLVNPEGYVLQGWELDEDGEAVGSVTDIQLSSFTSAPKESGEISVITNLDADASGDTEDITAWWDATQSPPLSDNYYEYQTTVKVYDSLGSTHDITIYFDRTSADNEWEYLIACNPEEDRRTGAAGTECAGLLAKGTLNFSASSGTLDGSATAVTMSLFTGGSNWTEPDETAAPGNWQAQSTASDISSEGYFSFSPEFISGEAMEIGFDIGAYWDGTSNWVNDSLTTTQFAKSSSTTYQAADGYGAGDLQGVDVDTDGVITGIYSNGQLIPLYEVALAGFQNPQGLVDVGSNLYRETRESGSPITNYPGYGGLGSISPNSLEQSNVDIATEFVRMITIQRSYQANSKIITTVDSMLSDAISMKR